MKVAEVTISDDRERAFIVLRPSWLARLFGASMLTVELERTRHASEYGWSIASTGRSLSHHEHRNMIVSALESKPLGAVAEIPLARWVESKSK